LLTLDLRNQIQKDMPAYVIVDVNVTDPALYEEYKKLTPGSIAPFGGRFVVRGGRTECVEGGWNPGRIVVLEFPDIEKTREWYNSPGYQEAMSIRHKASTARMIFVDGG